MIDEGVGVDAPTLVAVAAGKIDLLRSRMGASADHVRFVDMEVIGSNPARIIPVWREFVDDHPRELPVRGVGEPVWPGRSDDELVECHRHEGLLNLAFLDAPNFRLTCPYDTSALDPSSTREAERTHPWIGDGNGSRPSATYRGIAELSAPFDDPLPPRPRSSTVRRFDVDELASVRAWIAEEAKARGLPSARVDDLAVAAGEVTTNTVRHGGGSGWVRLWATDVAVICEVIDRGSIRDPLADRRKPSPGQGSGYGLWIANQICDLVQIRSSAAGPVVRVHIRLGP